MDPEPVLEAGCGSLIEPEQIARIVGEGALPQVAPLNRWVSWKLDP